MSYISKDSNLSIIFGSAIFENTKEAGALNPDGYIYNFGYRDDKNASYSRGLVVSRVKAEEIEDFQSTNIFLIQVGKMTLPKQFH